MNNEIIGDDGEKRAVDYLKNECGFEEIGETEIFPEKESPWARK